MVQTVMFKSAGVQCAADLYKPAGARRGKRGPAIVMGHGFSLVKGCPRRNAAKARRATGATPIRQAAIKAHLPICGAKYSTIHAAPSNSAVKITSLPLPVWYQRLPRSAGSSCTWPGLP